MYDDVTGKDKSITVQAIAIAAMHRRNHQPPEKLMRDADIAIKYLQSLPEDDELRIGEYAMRAVLLGRYSDLWTRRSPQIHRLPILSPEGSSNFHQGAEAVGATELCTPATRLLSSER